MQFYHLYISSEAGPWVIGAPAGRPGAEGQFSLLIMYRQILTFAATACK